MEDEARQRVEQRLLSEAGILGALPQGSPGEIPSERSRPEERSRVTRSRSISRQRIPQSPVESTSDEDDYSTDDTMINLEDEYRIFLPPTPPPPPAPSPPPPPPYVRSPRQHDIRTMLGLPDAETMNHALAMAAAATRAAEAATSAYEMSFNLLDQSITAMDRRSQELAQDMASEEAASPVVGTQQPPPSPPPAAAATEPPSDSGSAVDMTVISLTLDTSPGTSRSSSGHRQDSRPSSPPLPMELDNSGRTDSERPASPSLLCQDEPEKPVPCPVASANLYAQLSKLLECPVCLDVMRPDTKTVGSCENGHIVCPRCAKELAKAEKESSQEAICPSCRSSAMDLESHNFVALRVLDVLAQSTIYKCAHPTCFVRLLGSAIPAHEAVCRRKPYKCPASLCKQQFVYEDLFKATSPLPTGFSTKSHDCLALVHCVRTDDDTVAWNYTLNLSDIFSFDRGVAHVSTAFRPLLLLPYDASHDTGVSPERISEMASAKFKLYLSALAMADTGGVMFYISCLESNDLVTDKLRKTQFTISGHVKPYAGDIGAISIATPVFVGMVMSTFQHGLFLTRGNLTRFLSIMDEHVCRLCGFSSRNLGVSGYHMHLQITEKIPVLEGTALQQPLLPPPPPTTTTTPPPLSPANGPITI